MAGAGYRPAASRSCHSRSAAGVDVAQVALFIDQPHGGDGLDGELPREFIVHFWSVKILRPFHLVAGDKFLQALLLAVQADPGYLEPPLAWFFSLGSALTSGISPHRAQPTFAQKS